MNNNTNLKSRIKYQNDKIALEKNSKTKFQKNEIVTDLHKQSLCSDSRLNKNSQNFLSGIIKNKVYIKDKFINLLMIDGKKSVATRLVFDALYFLKHKYLKQEITQNQLSESINLTLSTNEIAKESEKNGNQSVLQVLSIAIDNVTPSVEVRKVRRAGNTFLIPAILSPHKANTLAMRWIIDSARKKQQGSNLSFAECLADEIYQAYGKQGKARQKRDELHSVATNNRANIRFRWW